MRSHDQVRTLSDDALDTAIQFALDGLSDRRRVFCELVVGGMSYREAAVKAGYSKKSSGNNVTQITRNHGVATALALLRERASRAAEVDAGWVRSTRATPL